jgi:DNA-binding transcriptional LysR family regulator
MEDKFRGIEVFVKIVELGSIRGAADELGISKSVVSFELKRLEGRLNARLLNRTTRHISLTETGKRFVAHSRILLGKLREAELEASDSTLEPQGFLKVAAAPGFGSLYLAPLIAAFAKLYPKITIQLDLDVNFVNLIADAYDVAIRVTILPDSELKRRRIASNHMLICATSSYLESHPSLLEPRELEQHVCLRYSDDWPYWSQWLGTLTAGERPRKLHCALTCNSVHALRLAALGGAGLVILPKYVVGNDVNAGHLVQVLKKWPYTHGEISAVFPHSEHMAAKSRVFIDFMAERLGRENVLQ